MPRTRIHSDDAVLDATADVVLSRGARAATINAIAVASGAPVGSLYHRFGSREGVLRALWERAIHSFHHTYIPTEIPGPDPVVTGVGMAESVLVFANENPAEARLLMTLRPADLLDRPEELGELNAAAAAVVGEMARALDVSGERVRMALVDLPYGSVRRHLSTQRPISTGTISEVGDAARILLTAGGADG